MYLKTKKLSVGYTKKQAIVSNINLTIEKGEVVLVIGENGVGKSTLLKTLAGLLPYKHGEIKLFEKELESWNLNHLAKELAYVASNENINGMLSVLEFVAFGRYPFTNWLMKLSKEDNSLVENAISDCGITYLKNKKMDEISDGEKQKVFLAKALAQNTPFLILDEPTSHLDIKSSRAVLKLISNLKSKGKTIIFSSHYVEKSLEIASKVWVVDQSKVIATTPIEFNNSKSLKELIFGE